MSLNESERSTLVNLYLKKAWDTYRDAQLAKEEDVLPNLLLAENFIKNIERILMSSENNA